MRDFTSKDMRDLRGLWQECFGVSSEGDRLLHYAGGTIKITLLCRHDGSIAGMAPAIPVHMGGLRGVYLYGVCVSPRDRGRGGLRRLTTEAFDSATGRGMDFLTLIPATDALRETYLRIMPGAWDKRAVAIPRYIAPAGLPLAEYPGEIPVNEGALTITPERGFLAFLRSYFTPMTTPEGDFLLCGEKNDAGERKIYEYVKHNGTNCDTIKRSDIPFRGLIAPLGGAVLPDGEFTYACTMGEV